MWYDCQKGQYDLGKHLVEYEEQNEVANESIAVNIPWTYAVAICSEHHTFRKGTISEAYAKESNQDIKVGNKGQKQLKDVRGSNLGKRKFTEILELSSEVHQIALSLRLEVGKK